MLLSGCATAPADPWEQLSPTSPCYAIDLTDGFDDATELRLTFDCLDRQGHLESLHPTVDALSADEERGLAALATGLDRGAEARLVFDGPPLPAPATQDLLLELLTGHPGDTVGSAPPGHQAAPWVGIGPAMELRIRALRDQPQAVAAAAAMVRHPSLEAALVALDGARHQPQGPFIAPTIHHVAAAGVAADPNGALVEAWIDSWVVDPLGVLPRSFFPLQLLTSDPSWRADVTEAIARHDDLSQVPAAVAWLASVDADGEPLAPGRTSALARILTLLERGTAPVECTVGIEPLAIDLSFDDLTVRLLRIVAGMEPDTLGSAASTWSTLTDNAVADAALDVAVASGACPAFDEAAQEGLDALDLLTAAQAAPLLELLLPLLDTTERHQVLSPLASVLGAVGSPASVAAVDGLAATVASQPDAALAARGLQGLASPVPGDDPPLRHLLDGLAYALAGDADTEGPPAVVLYPWLREAAADPELRRAAGRLAFTWADPRSHVAQGLELTPTADQAERGFAAARILVEPEVAEPLLTALSAPGVTEALLATEPSPEGAPPPLVALEGAVRAGAISDALAFFEAATEPGQR